MCGTHLAVVAIRRLLRGWPGATTTLAGTLASGLLSFLVTNFGVWLGGGRYPRTAAGMARCYTAAIPFYRNRVVGDLVFTVALFGGGCAAGRLRAALATDTARQ